MDTFGAEYLQDAPATLYGCDCNDPSDPWTGEVHLRNGYELEWYRDHML